MRILYITETNPKKKIKLDPIDPEDLNIDASAVSRWSVDNRVLTGLLVENGMAEYLCNRQFLDSFYTHLQFMYANITEIDPPTLNLTNLKILNLLNNTIKTLQHIPPSCQQLYLDFNQICAINLKTPLAVELLSLSHNRLTDRDLQVLVGKAPQLRCLNLAYNRLEELRGVVAAMGRCGKLRVVICRNNPVAMLSFYWEYFTTQLQLDYFDNEKYIKPQPVKQKPPQPKQEKKQEKKDEKKDNKKDTKKGGKVQEKPPQQQKKVQVKIQVPKVRTQQDFKKFNLKVQINVLQLFTGTIYDFSIFPQQNLNIKKTQTGFWVVADLLDKKYSTQQNKIYMDSILPDGQTNRLNFQLNINEKLEVSYDNYQKLINGMTVYVYKQQPVVETDPDSGEQKVVLDDKKQVKMKSQCIGGTFVDLQYLLSVKKKQISRNSNLFTLQAVKQPLFKKPYQNQEQLITKNKVQFDTKLAQQEQQKRKKQQQQQAAKAQKKGGKDTKKAPAKKQTKKDSKQPIGDKKMTEKCAYPADSQLYRYLGEGKMYKCGKQHLGIKVTIE